MDNNLKKRLQILLEGHQIDKEIKEGVEKALIKIEKENDLYLSADIASSFVTHLALALMRIKKGEKIENVDYVVFQEIKEQKGYDFSREFSAYLEEELELIIPESEKAYISLHLCNLINQKQEEI